MAFEIIGALLAGAVGGVVWGAVGYLKNVNKPEGAEFDMTGLLTPAVIGAILGAASVFNGMALEDLGTMYMVALTPVVQSGLKAVYNYLKKVGFF